MKVVLILVLLFVATIAFSECEEFFIGEWTSTFTNIVGESYEYIVLFHGNNVCRFIWLDHDKFLGYHDWKITEEENMIICGVIYSVEMISDKEFILRPLGKDYIKEMHFKLRS